MKKLQSNFTTPEQSKRLLELGVPTNSADCYISNKKIFVLHNCTFQENFNDDLALARAHLIYMPHYLPCWSVGRLIEIYCLCLDERYSIEFIGQIHTRPMNKILDLFEYVKLDFSKLEEL